MPGLVRASIIWTARWLALLAGICAAGAIVGGILFPVFGHRLRMDLGTREMVRNGLLDGGFLALILAPGISLVVCLMWARSRGGEKN